MNAGMDPMIQILSNDTKNFGKYAECQDKVHEWVKFYKEQQEAEKKNVEKLNKVNK